MSNQRGSAIIVVIMIGLVISVGFAGFIGSTVWSEQRAVDAELAKTRAYWAEMGNFAYALSRISYSRLCDGCKAKNTDNALALILQAYFNELSNNQIWTYPDEATSYYISTTDTATPDNRSNRRRYSGYLMATSAYAGSTVISGLNGHLPLMELRLCVGLPNSGAYCGNIASNNGGNATAYFSINRLTNLPAP
jgi:hypothetical protein